MLRLQMPRTKVQRNLYVDKDKCTNSRGREAAYAELVPGESQTSLFFSCVTDFLRLAGMGPRPANEDETVRTTCLQRVPFLV